MGWRRIVVPHYGAGPRLECRDLEFGFVLVGAALAGFAEHEMATAIRAVDRAVIADVQKHARVSERSVAAVAGKFPSLDGQGFRWIHNALFPAG